MGTLERDERGGARVRHPHLDVAVDVDAETVGDAPVGAVVAVDRDARTLDVLAAPGSALAAVWRIAFEAGMDPSFPPEVEAEVARHVADPGLDDPSLADLEAVPFVTIDGPTARDLDQAIAVERDGTGFRILYAIADAAHAAPPGSATFAEALRRGASFYLPGLSIPMLPRALSEGVTSLNPDVRRRALVFDMRIDRLGRSTATTLVRARIRSRAKLSFGAVQRMLDDAAGAAPDTPYGASLLAMRDAGLALLRESESRDVVRYRRTEVDVHLEGLRFVVAEGLRDAVELHNEQVSLLCNREGARLLLEGGHPAVQPIYRVHPPPEPGRVVALDRMIEELVRAHDLPRPIFAWGGPGSGTSLSEYLQRLPESGPHARIARAIHRQAILTNLRSGYATEPAGHYGVGAEVYARFSSPMREVVGVFLHKEMLELLGLARPTPTEEDVALREEVVVAANRAKQRQKTITDRANALVIDQLLAADLARPIADRPLHRATVMGFTRTKVHVQLDEPSIDLKLWVADLAASLGRGPLAVDGPGVTLRVAAAPDDPSPPGEARPVDDRPAGSRVVALGDAVDLRLERRDERGRWILGLVPSSPVP